MCEMRVTWLSQPPLVQLSQVKIEQKLNQIKANQVNVLTQHYCEVHPVLKTCNLKTSKSRIQDFEIFRSIVSFQ